MHVDLRHGELGVLVNDALRSVFETADNFIIPPLHQVTVLVKLTTCNRMHQINLKKKDRLYMQDAEVPEDSMFTFLLLGNIKSTTYLI
jgi:hypothetical protein